MNVIVATKLAGDPNALPLNPFPEVQPPASLAPKPISAPDSEEEPRLPAEHRARPSDPVDDLRIASDDTEPFVHDRETATTRSPIAGPATYQGGGAESASTGAAYETTAIRSRRSFR